MNFSSSIETKSGISRRLRLSRYVSRTILAAEVAYGLLEAAVLPQNHGATGFGVAIIAGGISGAAVEREMAIRKSRKYVRNYAASRHNDDLDVDFDPGEYVTTLVSKGSQFEDVEAYDPHTSDRPMDDTPRAMVQACVPVAAAAAGVCAGIALRGEYGVVPEVMLGYLGLLTLSVGGFLEHAGEKDTRRVEDAYHLRVDNIDNGLSFAA
jgi:hypothetical protein